MSLLSQVSLLSQMSQALKMAQISFIFSLCPKCLKCLKWHKSVSFLPATNTSPAPKNKDEPSGSVGAGLVPALFLFSFLPHLPRTWYNTFNNLAPHPYQVFASLSICLSTSIPV